MSLSGWTRLWIVASVIWWAVGACILMPQLPILTADQDAAIRGCAPPESSICQVVTTTTEATLKRAWEALMPSFVTWLGGPLFLWLLLRGTRWVARGFSRRNSFGA